MADTAYTYAVARIRAKETSLFSDADIENLVSCKSYENCIAFLHEKGWGSADRDESADELLSRERAKIWQEVRGMAPDEKVFDVLNIPKAYHNLKAAIKQVCTEDAAENIYYEGIGPKPEELREMIEKRELSRLPLEMAVPATEAVEALLQTGDGQLCDIIMDRAALCAVKKAGDESGSPFIKNYANETVAVADIRIAVRSARTGKKRDFMERSMAPCDRLDMDRLIEAASKGVEDVCEYLENAGYGEAAECIKESSSAFERWCDNRIIDIIMSQKYNPFSEGPLVAYVLARENEIKTVQIILTGKANSLSDDFIRERIRKMYV